MRPEQIVEATLFASQSPLTAAELARADEGLDADRVREAIATLRGRYEAEEHAFQIYQLGDGYQILTRPEFAPYLERFDSVPRTPTLSAAALETLAIIAYRQPIGRIEIEEVRGVSASSVLSTLIDWELIEVVGRGEGLGRPFLYGVTRRFFDHFGFSGMDDLPDPEELPIRLRELGAMPESDGEAAQSGASPGAATDEPEEDTAAESDDQPAAEAEEGGEPPGSEEHGEPVSHA